MVRWICAGLPLTRRKDNLQMKFDIKNRVQFTADIDCSEDESYSVKLGLAVLAAVKAGAH